jgi:hypothetical protein
MTSLKHINVAFSASFQFVLAIDFSGLIYLHKFIFPPPLGDEIFDFIELESDLFDASTPCKG